MKPIFGRGPSLQVRLFFLVILSVVTIILDTQLATFAPVRMALNTLVSPLQYLADAPKEVIENIDRFFKDRDQLQQENAVLKHKLQQQRADLLLFDQMKQENKRLRQLLDSPVRTPLKRMVSEVMAVDSDPFTLQVVINRGWVDGVYDGQPVIDEAGVVGQVKQVAARSSRVLLIGDSAHAIPVRIARNDIRAIASGTGTLDRLTLEHLPNSTDIKVGDILMSSGLGGRFPEGYPVAEVTRVDKDRKRNFAQIDAKPIVQLDRLRYLLLLWPEQHELPPKSAEVSR